jgi:hypothetical protein
MKLDRRTLPDDAFALPEQRKYIIADKLHARLALDEAKAHATPDEKKLIADEVSRRYPALAGEARNLRESSELADAPLSANTREANIDPMNGAGLDKAFADTDESHYESEL